MKILFNEVFLAHHLLILMIIRR